MSDLDLDSLGAVLPLPYRIGVLLTAGMSSLNDTRDVSPGHRY